MITLNLILIALVLLFVVVVLIYFLVRPKKQRKIEQKSSAAPVRAVHYEFPMLLQIIKDKESSSQELQEALDLVLKYFPTIHPKLGMRAHPDFERYEELLLFLCWHPNVNSKMIVKFEKELSKNNPEYKTFINDSMTKGLDSRLV